MPSRPPRLCGGCSSIVPAGQPCPVCAPAVKRDSDHARGTSTQRGYGTAHRNRFRRGVLARDPVCVLCRQRVATVADHFPLSRRQLVARGLDPNDAQHGRGLCKQCHDTETAKHQPGGWNRRG